MGIGQFFELEAAIAAAVPNHPAHRLD